MKFFGYIAQFLKNSNDRNSLMRALCAYGVGVYVTVWAFLSIRYGVMQSVTIEQVALVGTLVAGKVAEKKIDTKKTIKVQNEPTPVEPTEG